MIARLETELEERNAMIQGTIASAQDTGRDLTDNETELITSAKKRVDNVRSQLDLLWDQRTSIMTGREKVRDIYAETNRLRGQADLGPIEYRSAGAYILELFNANTGDRQAKERLEVFYRAAAHQKTGDNLGIIPDPIVGEVLSFIDAARPLVTFDGPRDMPSATWHRPKVTQHTTVATQGAGGAADEKTELSSQKMTITRLTATAVTYGGYVNVSRQNMDFSSPNAMDVVINDLAGQYAIATEAVFGAALIATANTIELTTAVAPAIPTAAELTAGLWGAVAAVYTAVKGQGRIALAVSPGKLGSWGPMFMPVGQIPNSQVSGFNAGDFGQGVIGTIAGIPVIVSAGIVGAATDFGVVFSTAAIETYEQRVGSLQAIEPSVLGVQVAYAGYFTPLVVEAGGIQRIINVA